MKKLLKIAWLIVAFGMSSTTHLEELTTAEPSLCPQLAPECDCYGFDYVINVNCVNVDDLPSIVDVLNTIFDNKTINHIRLTNSSLKEIPPSAFANLTVNKVMFARGFIRNVSDQAFHGVVELKQLIWQFISGFKRIPQAVIGQSLGVFRLVNSDVTNVGLEVHNMDTLYILDLSNNKISSIHPKAFLKCTSLGQLILNSNKIKKLDSNILRNVRFLEILSLVDNQLTTLDGVLKPSAMYIQELHLDKNLFSHINSILQFKAPNLKNLYLGGNPLKSLHSQDFNNKFLKLSNIGFVGTSLHEIGYATFSSILQLQTLYLSENRLTELPVNSFPHSLEKLYLDRNLLTNVSGVFKNLNSLGVLSLHNNRIKDIGGMFSLMPGLTKLDLSYNLIETIPNGSFANLPQLKILLLSSNRIQHLTSGSFTGLNQELYLLHLGSNLIKDLGGAFHDEKNLPSLKMLWLYNNSIQALSDKDLVLPYLLELDLGKNKLSSLSNALFNLGNLQFLKLQSNQLETIRRSNFPDVINVKELVLTGNPLACDCRLLWLVDSSPTIAVDRSSVCASPKWLKNFHIHELSHDKIITWKDNCPPECNSCKCYPRLGEITIQVNCQGRNLTSIPSVYPAQTLLLNLTDNSLKELPKELAQYVPNLENLDLHRNFLTTLNGVNLPLGLKALNLSENNFTVFPKDELKNLDLTNAEVSRNPWLCDCNANEFRLWLLKNNREVQDINETRCSKSDANGRLRGQLISSLTEFDLCPVQVTLYAIIAVGVLAFLLSAAGGFIGYIRYRMPIKVWLYNKGLCLRWVKEDDLDEDKDFDAFVAFSTEEQHCVDEILAELEEKPPYFRLCVHYRDFIGGQLIVENIDWAVKSSKKTLILLSKSFLEGEWTMAEFRQAHHHIMDEKIHRIILVLIGDLPPDDDIDEDVKGYLKKATYLRWEDKYLWQKLRYAMPRNPVPREGTKSETSGFFDNDVEPFLRVPELD